VVSSQAPDVSAYIDEVPAARREAMLVLRELVRRVRPEATESMRFRMPTYDLDGQDWCAFASQKQYISIYVMDQATIDRHLADLAGCNVGKCCIRAGTLEGFPMHVIETILTEAAAR